MTGTQKQIEWAEQIKATALPVIEKAVAWLKSSANFDAAKHGRFVDAAANMAASESASFWIDERDGFRDERAVLFLARLVADGKVKI